MMDEFKDADIDTRKKTSTVMFCDKYQVLHDTIIEIDGRKEVQYKKYTKLRKMNNVLNVSTTVLQTCTVTGLVVTFSTANPPVLIFSMICSSMALVLNSVKSSYNLDNKLEKHHTTFHQYSDLSRELKLKVAKNNLSSDDITEILADANQTISLIYDSSIE